MGKAWKFGDNLNTDEIIPARYNITIDPQELAAHVFCEIKPEFPSGVKAGDIVIGGNNFGCGSSREHAPVAIQGAGVRCVIAASFARIFFRNAINIGLPILVSPEASQAIQEGDEVEANLETGEIRDLTRDQTFRAAPLPGFVLKIVAAGGLVPFLKNHDLEEMV